MIHLDEGGRQRHARLIAPPPDLCGVVEHLWVQARHPRNTWRVVPDLNPYIIFYLAGGTAVCRIVGARTTYCDVDVLGRDVTIGARLRPGVLPLLIRDSASQLRDDSQPLDSVLGAEGRLLSERLADAPPGNRVPLLTGFLRGRLFGCVPQWPSGLYAIGDLVKRWDVSRRETYDRTIEAVGLAPKLAFRIERLHKALVYLHTTAPLADVAIAAGYADQPHLTRESTALLGEPPGEWRRRGCSIVQDSQRPPGE